MHIPEATIMHSFIALPLVATLLFCLAACGGETAPPEAGERSIQQDHSADTRNGDVADVADGAAFCNAWSELQHADSPTAEQLQALLAAAPPALGDAVAMYVGKVEEHGTTRGIVSAMDFQQEMQLFALTDWYVQNCVGD
jgi:hypothetical protein